MNLNILALAFVFTLLQTLWFYCTCHYTQDGWSLSLENDIKVYIKLPFQVKEREQLFVCVDKTKRWWL